MEKEERTLDTAVSLARHLGVHKLTCYRLAREGKIPSIRLTPRTIRFDRAAVLSALADNGTEGRTDDHR